MRKPWTKQYMNELTYQIIGAAIEVHKEVGPGHLEQVYELCLIRELELNGLTVTNQKNIAFEYKGFEIKTQLRYDLLIEDCIIVDLKSVTEIHPISETQIMTYINLLKKPKGILINFNCTNIFKEGQKTFVNDIFRNLPDR